MNYLSEKKNDLLIHFIFLFILSLYYLIPYFLVGQLILGTHDQLDGGLVDSHIIGRILSGDFESVDLFLNGEIKWYFLKKILQPLMLLYAIFETEFAYWLTDILVKLIFYICFFKLAKKLNCSHFNSALIACLIVSSAPHYFTAQGIGLATFPYLIYLMIKNKNLNLKHYCLIVFIGLNFDLVFHMFILPILFLVPMIFCPKNKKYNFELFIKISFVLFFFALLSNSNLIYTYLFSGPFHRADLLYETTDIMANFGNLIRGFFSIPSIKGDAYFFQGLLFTLYSFFIILISLFSRNKKTYLLLLIIFFIHFFVFILNLEFVNSVRNSNAGLFKLIRWESLLIILPILYCLLFVTNIKFVVSRAKYLIYPLIFLSIITSQIRTSIIPLSKHFLSFESLSFEQKNKLRKSFHDQKYSLLIKDIIHFNENRVKNSKQSFKSRYTFKGYYDYENYKYIKSLVGDSRTISIVLDPMVAVMNNIKVIDGYHVLYSLSYKLKFRKVIQEQLADSERIKKYYDKWGSRIYTFVQDKKSIKTNFLEANLLGADYVISKYSISNQILVPICEKCNNSPELFLYKIVI